VTTASTREVVLHHLPLIRAIAARLSKRLPPTVEVGELINIGVLGLLNARDRYDDSKGVPFKAYAEMRIRGQMLDALRDNDIVPRSVRRKHNRLKRERDALRHRLGRVPTRTELRAQLDMAPKKFDAYVSDAIIAPMTSLDISTTRDGSNLLIDNLSGNDPTAEDSFGEQQVRSAVSSAIQKLPEKERFAVIEYYLQHRTLKSIGAEMGVTESRACQLRSQGVKRLRARLRGIHG
jgi:RNA polymerase sigma factor for flagellar operon FliA